MVAVEWTCKPDSVPSERLLKSAVIISLGPKLPKASSDLPENIGWASLSRHLHENKAITAHVPQSCRIVLLFGLAPGDACLATCVTTGAVGSYPPFSPLPELSLPDEKTLGRTQSLGGIFSVAPVSDHSAWVLPSTLPSGVRTFLPPPKR